MSNQPLDASSPNLSRSQQVLALTQRQINLGLFIMVMLGAIFLLIVALATNQNPIHRIAYTANALLITGLVVAYWRGFEQARYIVVVCLVLMISGAVQEPYLTKQFDIVLIIPPVVALVLTEPAWVIGSAIATWFLLATHGGWVGVYTGSMDLFIYSVGVSCMALSRLAVDHVQRLAMESQRTAQAILIIEEQKQALIERTAEQERLLAELHLRTTEQERLLTENQQQRSALLELSVPIMPVSQDTLVVPLIGALDSYRLNQLHERTLAMVQYQHTRHLLLDVTGVLAIDSAVAHGLVSVVRAARLLGTDVTLVGIRPEVAQTIVSLGLDLSEIQTSSTIETALASKMLARQALRNK